MILCTDTLKIPAIWLHCAKDVLCCSLAILSFFSIRCQSSDSRYICFTQSLEFCLRYNWKNLHEKEAKWEMRWCKGEIRDPEPLSKDVIAPAPVVETSQPCMMRGIASGFNAVHSTFFQPPHPYRFKQLSVPLRIFFAYP